MIHAERVAAAPEILLAKGKKEQDKADRAWKTHLAAAKEANKNNRELPKKPSFKFEAYKSLPVKDLLSAMFHGKCAYCESFYSSTQPMDVEHFRPKGAVADAADHPGYYWLAGTWDNLLPSCIDCNRKRGQRLPDGDEVFQLGKKDQFPIAGVRASDPAAVIEDEKPLLINPCNENPDEFLRFDHAMGIVVPRTRTGIRKDRADKSIKVYGLNRSSLVTDRLHVLRMIDHHLEIVRLLTEVRDGLDGDPDVEPLMCIVDEVILLELQVLLDMRDPARPYSGMARQVLDELAPNLELPA